MFSRKSKLNSDLPKPPSKAEILDDLETFNLGRDKLHRRLGNETTLGNFSTSDSSLNLADLPKKSKRDGKETEKDKELDEWWETFEKFLNDIDKLETYQKQFQTKKMDFTKLDESIGLIEDDIKTRINDSLQKAIEEIPESEQDLK